MVRHTCPLTYYIVLTSEQGRPRGAQGGRAAAPAAGRYQPLWQRRPRGGGTTPPVSAAATRHVAAAAAAAAAPVVASSRRTYGTARRGRSRPCAFHIADGRARGRAGRAPRATRVEDERGRRADGDLSRLRSEQKRKSEQIWRSKQRTPAQRGVCSEVRWPGGPRWHRWWLRESVQIER